MAEYSRSPGHETRDAPVRVPLYYMLITAVIVVLGGIGILILLHSVWQPPAATPPPFAGQEQISSGPELQTDPAAELARHNRRMHERLNTAGWVDSDAGIVHMPIDRAMDLLVRRGLPASDSKRSDGEKTR